MQGPTVESVLQDDVHGVTYVVRGYRTLTRAELLAARQVYLMQHKGKHPKKGSCVTVISVLR